MTPGKFFMCVSAKTENINDTKDCDYNTTTGNILITANDEKFKTSGKYGIFVKSLDRNGTTGNDTVDFGLVISSQESETTLIPGIFQKLSGRFINREFIVYFDGDSPQVLLTIEANDSSVSAKARIEGSGESTKPMGEWKTSRGGSQGAIFFDSTELATHCVRSNTTGIGESTDEEESDENEEDYHPVDYRMVTSFELSAKFGYN